MLSFHIHLSSAKAPKKWKRHTLASPCAHFNWWIEAAWGGERKLSSPLFQHHYHHLLMLSSYVDTHFTTNRTCNHNLPSPLCKQMLRKLLTPSTSLKDDIKETDFPVATHATYKCHLTRSIIDLQATEYNSDARTQQLEFIYVPSQVVLLELHR